VDAEIHVRESVRDLREHRDAVVHDGREVHARAAGTVELDALAEHWLSGETLHDEEGPAEHGRIRADRIGRRGREPLIGERVLERGLCRHFAHVGSGSEATHHELAVERRSESLESKRVDRRLVPRHERDRRVRVPALAELLPEETEQGLRDSRFEIQRVHHGCRVQIPCQRSATERPPSADSLSRTGDNCSVWVAREG